MLRDFPLSRDRAAVSAGPGTGPVPVRDAATVMLVRAPVRPDGPARGLEVFTIRRTPRMAFAPGMLVFPGGAVEERDADPRLPWYGPSPSALGLVLGAPEPLARAIVAAAVRETFEETGALLAGGARPGGVLDGPSVDDAAWEARRTALVEGRTALADVLLDAGLVLRADLLRPWAHWITPSGENRRFDTRFFAAALPPGQQARYLPGEADRASWLPAAEAVREHAAGRLPMLPPTIVALEELAAAPSVRALLATPRRVRPVSPWPVRLTSPDGAVRDVLRVDLDGLGGGQPGPL